MHRALDWVLQKHSLFSNSVENEKTQHLLVPKKYYLLRSYDYNVPYR